MRMMAALVSLPRRLRAAAMALPTASVADTIQRLHWMEITETGD